VWQGCGCIGEVEACWGTKGKSNVGKEKTGQAGEEVRGERKEGGARETERGKETGNEGGREKDERERG
jgi:hypothetical protein